LPRISTLGLCVQEEARKDQHDLVQRLDAEVAALQNDFAEIALMGPAPSERPLHDRLPMLRCSTAAA
jgi:hypothetical protein